MRPGDFVDTIDAAVDYDPSLATDQLFVAQLTEKGPVVPKRTFSFAQWTKIYGGNVAWSPLYYTVMALFKEGLKALVTQRVVGENPVHASSTAENNSSVAVIKIEANDAGAYGNTLTRQFVAGEVSGVQLILAEGSKVLTRSGDLATQGEIVAWGNATGIVTVSALGGSGLPVVDGSAVALTGGTDDHTKAGDVQFGAALNLLDVRMGPGQVALPGRTTEAAHTQLREHGEVFDRIPLYDLPDSSSAGTLTGNVVAQRANLGANKVGAFAPWVITPEGVEIPACALVGGKIAQTDLKTGNPNEPAAGSNGEADWITDLTQDFSASDRETLDEGGVNAIYDTNGIGAIQVYGYDTLVSPEVDPLTTALSNARQDMLIRWRARAIAKTMNFKEIDSQGLLASDYNAKLTAMLKEMVGDGALYGFTVDTQSVNNSATASEEKLLARIGVERSKYAKTVWLEVENFAIGEGTNV
jgi:hypothetical protein